MSIRPYNLRNRHEAGTVAQPMVPMSTNSLRRDIPPHIPNTMVDTDAMTALYSDVVASRPPSPRKEIEASVVPSAEDSHSANVVPIGNINDLPLDRSSQSSYETETPMMDEGQWTTVQRRRARSLNSLDKARVSRKGTSSGRKLTKEQLRLVEMASRRLTASQKEVLQRRHGMRPAERRESTSSRGEGPSRPKGKGIDLREWGNANLSSESLDLEAQAAALKSFAHYKDSRNERGGVQQNKTSSRRLRRSAAPQLPAESRPVDQIAQNSYIGAALRNVGRNSHRREHPGHDDPSSSDPDSTDSGKDTSGSSGNRGNGRNPAQSISYPTRRRQDNRHGRNKRRRYSSSSGSDKGTIIKPIAPKEYDGQADARAYHRFVRESEAYLKDGRVKGRRRIFLLSYYLTGKAYDFYTQRVSTN